MYEDHKTYAPLYIVEHEEEPGTYSLYFSDDQMLDVAHVFEPHGRTGGGYSWADVALALIHTRAPELKDTLDIDAEAGMFFANGDDLDGLQRLAILMAESFRDRKKLAELARDAPWEWE